ncbi:hypothetical protein [Miltoncostaea oceani]|uniref:hypothetical protein n=1 Tax=Miltoncostaea oceani TaxID=2843216 RepID=UPI001FE78593|nr:hypothetical protein [Miltoncostaea oceani]
MDPRWRVRAARAAPGRPGGGARAPALPPPAAAAAAATQPLPAVRVVARPELLLAVAALALAGFALLAVWMPVLGTPAGTDSLWTLESTGFRVHGILAALLSMAAAGAWLAAVTVPAMAPARVTLAAATGLAGGLVAGLPLFLAAIDLEGVGTEAGLVLMLLAGLAISGCAVAGVARATAGTRPRRSSPAARRWSRRGAGPAACSPSSRAP